MAQVSDIQFWIVWNTERPYYGRSRKSSYFRVFGEEWFLHIWMPGLKKDSSHICYVNLYRRGGKKILKTPFNISAACNIIINDKLLKSFNGKKEVTVYQSVTLLLKFDYPPDQFKSEKSEYWKVICQLYCEEGLSLEIKNETTQLSIVDVRYSSKSSADKYVQTSQEIPQDMKDTFSRDTVDMLEKKVPPDFQLNCGGRSFPIHRSMLSAYSEVFAILFQNKAAGSGIVNIKDIEAPVLELLLNFVYSGKLENISEGTVESLYEAAIKYDMRPLQSACSSWMIPRLSEKNCLRYLLVADSHSDSDLKNAAVLFIVNFPAVLMSSTWRAFSKEHPVLAVEVLNTVFAQRFTM